MDYVKFATGFMLGVLIGVLIGMVFACRIRDALIGG